MIYDDDKLLGELLGTYSPILFYHKKEKFRPIEVDAFLKNSCLVENVDDLLCVSESSTSSQFIPNDHNSILVNKTNENEIYQGEGLDKNRKNLLKQQATWLKEKQEPKFTIYGRYYVDEDHLTLTYYFFYLGNDVHYRIRRGYSHDCDWEMIRIFFVRNPSAVKESDIWIPTNVLFQQHAYDEDNPDPMVSWDELHKTKMIFGNHVGVLTSRGGHASFPPTEAKQNIERHFFQMPITPRRNFEKAFNRIGTTTIFNQLPRSTGNAIVPFLSKGKLSKADLKVRGYYYLVNLDQLDKDPTSWVNFKGHWGLGKQVLGIGSNKGPVGPKFFLGLRRSYNYTRNPVYLEKEPEYWFNLAVEAHNTSSFQFAENQYHKMLELTQNNINYIRLRAFAYLNLSDICQIKKDIELSKLMGIEAIKLFENMGDKLVSAYIKISLALKFFEIKQRKEAFNLIDEAIISFQELGNQTGIAYALSIKHDNKK